MLEVILTKENRIDVLQAAIKYLKAGGVIIYPTETCYGLGVDFYNRKAVRKIYNIKVREKKKPLSILVPNITTANTLVEFPDKALRLAMQYWPGPLTLVLPYRHCNWGICYDEFLALRISGHEFANAIVNNYGQVITATSANLTGKGDCYTAQSIKNQFKNLKIQPDLFINAGSLAAHKPTTIIKCTRENKMELLRQGELKIKIN